ncbi:hypothetical protein [Saccharopolyspora hordei]|uniref:Small secreted protein n=1 Tax=Saccharopolyspora hordei TaxID=1838 RepID=A0A853ANF9_9PSEU|nr:hypothetical protein [Saccharopolyspora hordei]NYI81740.1 hypothetical protein [Saccharopolyspora hordei]
MNFRPTSLAALAAVPLVLAGCAGGGGQGAAPQPAPKPPAPSAEAVAWAGGMCDLVTGFSESQENLPAVDRSNTAAMKESVIERIDAAARSADDTARGLQDLGAPPVEGAEQLGAGFQQSFTQIGDVLRGAREKAEQVDPTDKQRFQDGMTAVQQELDKGGQLELQDELAQLEQNQELNAAVHQAPECASFFEPPQPPQQQPPR